MSRILIVEDEEPIQQLLSQILTKKGHVCIQASSTKEARECLKEKNIDLVLSDIMMPGESWLELVRHISSYYPDTAVVMVTGVNDPMTAEFALENGVYDYIIKPFEQNTLLISVANALYRRNLEINNRIYRDHLERIVADRTAALKESMEKLRQILNGTIYAIALTVETRDLYTAGHQKRVADLACAIAKSMGISEHQIEGIEIAASIHDIGKIYVPAEILSKPTALNEAEIAIVRKHPQIGYDILKKIEFPWPIARIVLQHHERILGSGYPHGLSGEDILLEARILAVADVVEAMYTYRPYRPALGVERALQEISENRAILYDPIVVDTCLELFIKERFKFEEDMRKEGVLCIDDEREL